MIDEIYKFLQKHIYVHTPCYNYTIQSFGSIYSLKCDVTPKTLPLLLSVKSMQSSSHMEEIKFKVPFVHVDYSFYETDDNIFIMGYGRDHT